MPWSAVFFAQRGCLVSLGAVLRKLQRLVSTRRCTQENCTLLRHILRRNLLLHTFATYFEPKSIITHFAGTLSGTQNGTLGLQAPKWSKTMYLLNSKIAFLDSLNFSDFWTRPAAAHPTSSLAPPVCKKHCRPGHKLPILII